MTRGVMRKVMRGITPYVTPDLLKSKKSHIDTRGHQRQKLWRGNQNVPTLLKLMYITPILSTASVWFQNIQIMS